MLNPTILSLANTLNAFHPRSPVSYLQVAHYCRDVSLDILKRMTSEIEMSLGQKGPTPDAIVENAKKVKSRSSYLLAEVKGVPKVVGRHFVTMPIDETSKARLMAMSQGCERNNVMLLCDINPQARYVALPYGLQPADLSIEEILNFDRGVADILVRVERTAVAFSKLYDVGGAPSGFLTQSTPLDDIYENKGLLVNETPPN